MNDRTLNDVEEKNKKNILKLERTVCFFEALLRASADGIVITDAAKNIIFVNDAFCKFISCNRHNVIGTNILVWLGKLSTNANEIWKELESQIKNNGIAKDIDFRMKTEAGMRYFTVNSSLLEQVDIEEPGLIISIWRDETERILTEKALAGAYTEKMEIFKAIVHTISDAVFWLDPEGNFIYVNESACKSLGYDHDELMKLKVFDVNPRADSARWNAVVRQFRKKKLFHAESIHRRKDGSEFPVEIISSYIKFDNKEYFCGFARNITERKHAEEFISRRNIQLRILSKAAQKINTVLEIPVILQNLIVSAMEITDSTAGAAGLIVNEKITFSEYNKHGKLFPIDYVFKKGYGVPGHVMETKSPYISNDAQNDPYVIQDIRKTLCFNNLANVPILDRKGEMLGLFQIHNTKEHRQFDQLDIEMLQGLASSAAIALENARLVEDIRKGEEEKKSLSSILEKSLNEIYMFDPETLRFTYVNSGACKNLGFTLEELRSMTPLDITLEYDEASFRKNIEPLIQHEKKKLLFYIDLQRANGSHYPVELHLQFIEQEGSRLFLAIIIDITERKRVEKALSFSEEKYRTLYETMAQGVIYHDESGKIISANPAAQKILGLSLRYLIGRTSIDPMWKAIHEDGSDFPGEKHPAMVTLQTRKEVRDVVMGVFNPEVKEYRWIQINAIPQTRYAETRPYQVYTTINDITELKRAKDEMQLANEDLRIINKIISTATGLLDINQILDTVLDECIKIVGLEGGTICFVEPDETLQLGAHRSTSKETIIDLTTNKIKIGECLCGAAARDLKPLILPDREAVIKFATREATRKEDIRYHAAFPLITRGKCVGVLCLFTRTDKKPDVKKLKIIELISSQVALSIRNAQLYEETKEYALTLEKKVAQRTSQLQESQSGLLNLMDDINKTAAELDKANKRLIELDIMKSMFIASTSHELRTPLNSILGFTSILLEGWSGELTPEQREQIQIVNTSGKHLLSLINDVIDISKIEAGKLEVRVSRFNLKEVIDEVVSTLKQELNGKGLLVIIDVADIELNTDRRRLLQCIMNLFSNAVKFTEKGEIKIIAKSSNNEIEISIGDSGIGIKKEDIPKLFTAFVRLDSPLTAKTSGTGLGLYLTRKLTQEVLGGKINVESEYGKGSIFSLRIPREVKI